MIHQYFYRQSNRQTIVICQHLSTFHGSRHSFDKLHYIKCFDTFNFASNLPVRYILIKYQSPKANSKIDWGNFDTSRMPLPIAAPQSSAIVHPGHSSPRLNQHKSINWSERYTWPQLVPIFHLPAFPSSRSITILKQEVQLSSLIHLWDKDSLNWHSSTIEHIQHQCKIQ